MYSDFANDRRDDPICFSFKYFFIFYQENMISSSFAFVCVDLAEIKNQSDKSISTLSNWFSWSFYNSLLL